MDRTSSGCLPSLARYPFLSRFHFDADSWPVAKFRVSLVYSLRRLAYSACFVHECTSVSRLLLFYTQARLAECKRHDSLKHCFFILLKHHPTATWNACLGMEHALYHEKLLGSSSEQNLLVMSRRA